MKIEEELQQKRFQNEHIKAGLNIMLTASRIIHQNTQILKPFDISVQQFNLLRILRGMYPEPATIKLITRRMVDKNSNASRMVERLRKQGWVERSECEFDRRRVDIFITEEGLKLVEKASQALEKAGNMQFPITEEEAKILNTILDKIRT